MELSWKRQHALEAAIQRELESDPCGGVWDVRNLPHLERVHEAAQNKVVVLFEYSRSCGICKHVLQLYEAMSKEVRHPRSGLPNPAGPLPRDSAFVHALVLRHALILRLARLRSQ